MSPAPTAAATVDAAAPVEPVDGGDPTTTPTDGPGSPRPVLLGTVTALQLIRRAA